MDVNLKASDINQELFKEFLRFLEMHFNGNEDRERDKGGKGSGGGGEDKCIPGGRYGCAQFVKACGTAGLSGCSLGQLAQFIQHAINEDILRYQRTLLVSFWGKKSHFDL